MMKKIKSFIYLDNYKMYSISSQLFKGLTEYIVKSESKMDSEKTEQKGEFGSGRIMADIIESETNHSEKRFLHHYSYNLFEDELITQNRVLNLNASNIDVSINELESYNFVKITGKIGFNDSKHIEETLRSFNSLGESLTYVVNKDNLKGYADTVKEVIGNTKDRNKKAQIQNYAASKLDIVKLAKEAGMHLDPKYLESLQFILNFGFNESFEVQAPFITDEGYYLFSGLLDRQLLTETELSIVKKYSRETEKEFTIFGIPTQVTKVKDKVSIYQNAIDAVHSTTEGSMKEGIMNLIASLTNVESTFAGKLDYEYIVDPIAVYREI